MNWVPITAVLAVLAILIISRWPVEASLGAYAFLLPFDSVLIAGYAGPIHLHITWFVGMAAVCVLLLTGLLNRGFLRPPRAALWLSLFVFWTGISFWWAIDPESATFRLPILGLLLLIYLASVSVPVNERELVLVGQLTILGGCVAAAISLYQFAHGQNMVPEGEGYVLSVPARPSLWFRGADTNPDMLAASLMLPLSLVLGRLLSARGWLNSLLMMGCTALMGTCIYLTMARSAVIAIVAILLVYAVRVRARWRLLLPVAFMGTAIAAMPNAFFSRMSESFEDRGAGRVDIWETGLKAFKHYGIFGAGLDCFPAAFDRYTDAAFIFRGFHRGPHNIYLGTGVELGVVGLALLTIFVAAHLRFLAKTSGASTNESSRLQFVSYEAACWSLLICGFFLDLLWDGYFWFTLMLLAMRSQVRQVTRPMVITTVEPTAAAHRPKVQFPGPI